MDVKRVGQTTGIVFIIVAAIFWWFDLHNYYGLSYFFGNFTLPAFLFPIGVMILIASSLIPDTGLESKFRIQLIATLLLLAGIFLWYYKLQTYYNFPFVFGRFSFGSVAIGAGLVFYMLSGFLGEEYGTNNTIALLGVIFLFFAFMAWWFDWQNYFNIGLFFGRFSFVHAFIALGIIFSVGAVLFNEE